MLNLNDIQKKHPTSETTVEVKSWGGEVKIRQLTVAESAEIVTMTAKGKGVEGMVKAVSFALVEPAISYEDLSELSGEAFDGIKEINDALKELNESKK